jgi:hypothetical protein
VGAFLDGDFHEYRPFSVEKAFDLVGDAGIIVAPHIDTEGSHG